MIQAQTGTFADPYRVLARYYDAETAHMRDDLAAYATLAQRYGSPVLDVGCGSGRVAFDLAARGCTVAGIDTSAAMLDLARRRSAHEMALSGSIRWLEADVTTLALDERFGLAIFAYNGFMHLLEQPQQAAALEHLYAHLKPGGALALDLPNPIEMFRVEDTPNVVLERVFEDPDSGDRVMQQSVASVDRGAQIMSVTWIYDQISPDGTVHRQLAPLTVRYTMPAELRLLLAHSGFATVELYGDYDFGPFDEDSPRLFAVAERGGAG